MDVKKKIFNKTNLMVLAILVAFCVTGVLVNICKKQKAYIDNSYNAHVYYMEQSLYESIFTLTDLDYGSPSMSDDLRQVHKSFIGIREALNHVHYYFNYIGAEDDFETIKLMYYMEAFEHTLGTWISRAEGASEGEVDAYLADLSKVQRLFICHMHLGRGLFPTSGGIDADDLLESIIDQTESKDVMAYYREKIEAYTTNLKRMETNGDE